MLFVLIYAANPGFLSTRIGTPRFTAAVKDDAVQLNETDVIPYTHFSLSLNGVRGFAFWVVWNIDGTSLKKLPRRGIKFVKDPRLPDEAQIGNELYEDNPLDRGHLARRADLLWGAPLEAKKANKDSFHYTNITPQMEDFNQSSKRGVWGRLEDALFAEVEVDNLKVSAFGGPVFQEDDRLYRDVQIPREFWKVLSFVEQGQLKAKAFLLTQNLNQLEALELDEFRVFRVALSEVESRGRFRFPAVLRNADTLTVPESLTDRAPLENLADIDWR
ncbi:DNA/RNA non-specific endonuclease [Streptomyces virginiae]|uniref:DNA/RNA non-specific endonuclease n=1 Tax=Streptomyces virginiae TaxID=1961 RepID=UPI0036A315F9